MVGNFFKFITNNRIQARGIIVAEARGQREDSELRNAFKMIYKNRVGSIKPSEIRNQILDLFIVPKKQDYLGTQIADMVLYPTYDAVVSDHNSRSDHFISFERDLKNKLLSKNVNLIP
ncbi:hypothetical protein ISR94_01840 [Candidatus Microgenomates bacterium]|nr:hypothetical protein [Candidatus Microgenomates bacterium]